MARIVLADDGVVFDGTAPGKQPLGGAEAAFVSLSEALANRGHAVQAYSRCEAKVVHAGVTWRPIVKGLPDHADLYIANRSSHLIAAMPGARARAFWTHNPCRYMLKARYLWPLFKVRPAIVFVGDYHAGTYPGWAPGGQRHVIPLGLPDLFRTARSAADMPLRRAIFTSNPLRGLDWLLDLWASGIRPRAPGAELHLFSGPSVYGALGPEKAAKMQAVLDRAKVMGDQGVVLHDPVARPQLLEELKAARVMLYRGDMNETYCYAVAEAQAVGVPVVVQAFGSMPERVVHGRTGFVAADDADFAECAVQLLTQDDLWRRQHDTALDLQRRWGWDEAAAAWERLLPED